MPVAPAIDRVDQWVAFFGLLNPSFGNTCVNGGYGRQQHHDGGKQHDDKKRWKHGKYNHR